MCREIFGHNLLGPDPSVPKQLQPVTKVSSFWFCLYEFQVDSIDSSQMMGSFSWSFETSTGCFSKVNYTTCDIY